MGRPPNALKYKKPSYNLGEQAADHVESKKINNARAANKAVVTLGQHDLFETVGAPKLRPAAKKPAQPSARALAAT